MNPILSTGSHEQDVRAMLELYDDLIERDEPPNDQETAKSDQENPGTTQSEPQNDQETTLSDKENSETTQTTTQNEPQNDKETTQSNKITI